MTETASGTCNPIGIKREPVDNLTVIIKTEWESEENTGGLPDYTKNDCPEMLQEETQLYPTVKREPVEIAFEEEETRVFATVKREPVEIAFEGEETSVFPTVKREPVEITFEECAVDKKANVDRLATYNPGVKKEITEHIVKKQITEQIVKKEEFLDYTSYSTPLQVPTEEERGKNLDGDSKTNVLVNIVPFLKQELDSNLHSIHERRSSSVSAGSLSESVPVFDDGEDSSSNCPDSPRLVIAESEDSSDGESADDAWEQGSLLGSGWRLTVFRCGHCMTLAWDVYRLASHVASRDCCVPPNRKLNDAILGRLRRGTQVKYVNSYGCHVCGKLFFKRKSYRKHVCTMHSENMLLPLVKNRTHAGINGCDQSSSENPESLFAARLKNDDCRENSHRADPKSADDNDRVEAEDSAVSSRRPLFVENRDNLKTCVVCCRVSCQMHKYIFIRAKNEVSEGTETFVCRACDKDFQCEENYWRHMYYHGFKTKNMLAGEPAAELQPDGRVGAKKTTSRRPRRKSGGSQPEQSGNVSSQVPLLSLTELCSPKSGSQREGTGVTDACEIRNSQLTVDRSASENKKRNMSTASLNTEEDGPDPSKKRCVLPVDHFSPAGNGVTVEIGVPRVCFSPRHLYETPRHGSSSTGDVCASVGTSEEREKCAVEGEPSDMAVDDVSSEKVEKKDCGTQGAVDEEIEIITEKLSKDHNSSYGAGETCSSPSLQLRKGLNLTAVEVIDILDDENEGGDTDNINDNGRDDRTSSYPESASFEIREKCGSHTEAVSAQENVGHEPDCSRHTSELEQSQLEKTVGSQDMEVDPVGKRPQTTACKETVGATQPVGVPFVQSGVSYGARVAVLKCVKGDDDRSRLAQEKQVAIGCEGCTGVRVLQVSNTAMYQTVPIRQITKLTLVPTVSGTENGGGTVSNLRMLSKVSLDVSGTPRTGACLLKCEKCSLLGVYSPEFFSHKCSFPNSGTNSGSKVLSVNGLRLVTNGTPGVIFPNSAGVGCQVRPGGGEAANRNLTGSVMWRCLRCKFATYHSDVFRSHCCQSVVISSEDSGVGTRCNGDVSPGAGPRRGEGVSPGDAKLSPGASLGCSAGLSPSAGRRRDIDVSPGDGTKLDAAAVPGAKKRSESDAAPALVDEYQWKCMGCGLNSNSRQYLLTHKCSSFKKNAASPFTSGPVLMCCKCGFKTAGRLMFATHQCAKFDLSPWWSRNRLLTKGSDRGALDAAPVKQSEGFISGESRVQRPLSLCLSTLWKIFPTV